MSGQSFKTTLPEMEQASNRVIAIREKIDAEMKKLRGQIELLAPVWQGSASTSMKMLFGAWETRQLKLAVVLGDVAEGIKSNGIAYARTEQDIKTVSDQTTGLLV